MGLPPNTKRTHRKRRRRRKRGGGFVFFRRRNEVRVKVFLFLVLPCAASPLCGVGWKIESDVARRNEAVVCCPYVHVCLVHTEVLELFSLLSRPQSPPPPGRQKKRTSLRRRNRGTQICGRGVASAHVLFACYAQTRGETITTFCCFPFSPPRLHLMHATTTVVFLLFPLSLSLQCSCTQTSV